MSALWFWLIVGTLVVQVPNIMGIHAGQESLTYWQIVKIALYTLPATFTATVAFIYFYGKGSELYSYSALTIYGKVAALVIALIIQVFWLGTRQTNWVELLGLSLAVVGLALSVYAKQIGHYLQHLTW